eukprot:3135632-Alexandrium_andersonii.AAC.1
MARRASQSSYRGTAAKALGGTSGKSPCLIFSRKTAAPSKASSVTAWQKPFRPMAAGGVSGLKGARRGRDSG